MEERYIYTNTHHQRHHQPSPAYIAFACICMQIYKAGRHTHTTIIYTYSSIKFCIGSDLIWQEPTAGAYFVFPLSSFRLTVYHAYIQLVFFLFPTINLHYADIFACLGAARNPFSSLSLKNENASKL